MTQAIEGPTGPSEKVVGSAHQIIIREIQRSRLAFQMGVGLLGLGVVAGGVASGYLIDTEVGPVVPLIAAFSVIGFGLASIASWRRSGECEILEIVDGRLRLLSSRHRIYIFDAPIEKARVQRVKHSLGTRLCLRDGERAVEVGNNLTPEQREVLAHRIDAIIASQSPPVPSPLPA